MSPTIAELQKIPIHERLQLVEDLWDSIALEECKIEIAPWQKNELDRRARDFEANPGSGIPWETAKAMICGQHG